MSVNLGTGSEGPSFLSVPGAAAPTPVLGSSTPFLGSQTPGGKTPLLGAETPQTFLDYDSNERDVWAAVSVAFPLPHGLQLLQ